MTSRLYYNDSYLRTFEASVVQRTPDGTRVYLDRTAFYPVSGGQPDDRGSIHGIPVIAVEDEQDCVAHVLAAPLTAERVACEIDWIRRYDHMQQHTGQHLLSAVCEELFGFKTLSFQMGAEVSTIELGTAESGAIELTAAQSAAIEDRANELALAALPVTVSYERAAEAANLRKVPSRSGELRIVTIEGTDRSACGGTHVWSTAELAPLQIRRQEKVRGNIRIEFVCGSRGLRRMRRDYRITAALARQMSCAIDDLPETIEQLRARFSESVKENAKLSSELARLTGQEMYRATSPDADGVRRRLVSVPSIDDTVRARLRAFTAPGKAIALAVGSGIAIQCSPDSGVNAGAVLKTALEKFGGRGGGSATSAQGSLPYDGGGESAEAEMLAELSAALGFDSTETEAERRQTGQI